MEPIKLTGIGFVLGITTIIPGLSTGTMAIVFNVYDRLIGIITPNIKKIIAAWKFLLPLAVGAIVGLIFFSRLITLLFANYPVPTYWFFIGLITGSLPLVYSKVQQPGSARLSFPALICCIIAFALMALMALMAPMESTASYTVLTPSLFGILVLGGSIAAIAMIIPGISGSFLLLVIGLYRTFVQAVSELNIPLILPVVLGAVIGLLLGAAFVRFLLSRVPSQTYGAVLGLVAGSVFVLFPGGFGEGIGVVISVACLLVGFFISFLMGRRQN
jgi:putative membrane protein